MVGLASEEENGVLQILYQVVSILKSPVDH